ncbi:MAG TPA: endopeptidase La [Pyrinomonadaceae bacterium]|jgi:ATP-dependent Lon protease|nr:endopeptidase La [Pyrinomonadaceae bacterium]
MAEKRAKNNTARDASEARTPDAVSQPPVAQKGAGEQTPPRQQEAVEQTPRKQRSAGEQTLPQGALDAAQPVEPDAAAQIVGEMAEASAGGSEVFEIAVLPLQQTTLFPGTVIPLAAGRPRSVAAVEAALSTEEKLLACITVREGRGGPEGEAAPPADLYEVGTLVMIKRMMRSEDGLQLIVHGTERVRVVKWMQTDPHIRARVRILPPPTKRDDETVEALFRNVQALNQRVLAMLPEVPPEIRTSVLSSNDPTQLTYFLASILNLGVEQEQQMLEADTVDELLEIAYARLTREVEIMELRTKIAAEAQGEMSKAQRDYFLRQQMKAIQKELGEDEGGERAEAELLRERLEQATLPDEVRKEAERELKRLERLPQAAPDYHVIRTWLEFVLELPWLKSSEDKLDLAEARRILDEDHYGLEEIKERILEFLAVVKLRRDSRSPILCFVGPPGVGKTSLGRSVAHSLGREFERLSLGGVRDEAELRGHRRTYIGAMPGRIIQSIRRAGVNNPVMMLDEIDKLGMDYRGDPTSALLEILDPQQNNTFIDHYLDLPFDLSKVFFIATANQLGPIPAPLRDRMEIIHLAGYSDQEKLHIARQYLVPRQTRENGLAEDQLEITDEALMHIAARYTREAGVRQLERTVGRVARKAALRIAQGQAGHVRVDVGDIKELLGAPRFYPEEARKDMPTGVATGMAWTEAGGQLLFIEATLLPGSSGLTMTGQLGEVMQESARAARSYLWSHAAEFGIDAQMFKNYGEHIHVPAGAIPKDGPSAGVAITSALASLMTGRRVRNDTAMTGEITLSGLVFPVGGIKEKVMAAHRAGLRRVVLPARNEPDTEDIPEDVRRELEFVYVSRIGEALDQTLEKLVAQTPPPPDPKVEESRSAGRQQQTEPVPVRARGL